MSEPSHTISEFCALERISRSTWYNLERAGKAPRTYDIGGIRRITPEARLEWQRAREAETAAGDRSKSTVAA